MMRVLSVIAMLLFCVSVAERAGAQQSFVQIEAHPSLAEAESRARGYARQLPNVNGFSLGGRWYGITLGPYPSPEIAAAALRQLRQQGAIPADSYVSQGETHRDRFWPLGAEAVAALETAPPPTDPAVEPVIVAPVVVPAPPPADETPQEARRSEAQLSRGERENLQRALQWFGYYTAAIDGSFGRGTRASMSAWQTDQGTEPTGILTTRQRATLIAAWRQAQAAIGLEPLVVAEAGIELTAPLGLVQFDRIEAPFVHYAQRDGSGVQMLLISQPGDRAVLGGLYEVLQTLELLPPEGPRGKERDAFRIRGDAPGRSAQAYARLRDGHIHGFILSWPSAQDRAATRALTEMEGTLQSIGAPLDPGAGFDAAAQSFDMVSGLQVRRPLRAASGFFVSGDGTVVTAAATVRGCREITLDRLHAAEVTLSNEQVAVLRPQAGLAPAQVALLEPTESRLRARMAVGGYPFGGVLGAATQTFGTLEDVRGLRGERELLRLSLSAEPGDAGGPVIDAAGNVAGMLLPAPSDDSRALPEDVAFAVKSSVLLEILRAAGLSVRAAETRIALPPEDLARRTSAITVLVSCWD